MPDAKSHDVFPGEITGVALGDNDSGVVHVDHWDDDAPTNRFLETGMARAAKASPSSVESLNDGSETLIGAVSPSPIPPSVSLGTALGLVLLVLGIVAAVWFANKSKAVSTKRPKPAGNMLTAARRALVGGFNYVSRSPRADFWWFQVFVIPQFVTALIASAMWETSAATGAPVPIVAVGCLVATIVIGLANIALTARRLRDAGLTPSLAVVWIVPFGFLVAYYFCIRPTKDNSPARPVAASSDALGRVVTTQDGARLGDWRGWVSAHPLAVVGVFLAAIVLWLGRYEVSAANGYQAFRLDRWTGEVSRCSSAGCSPVNASSDR